MRKHLPAVLLVLFASSCATTPRKEVPPLISRPCPMFGDYELQFALEGDTVLPGFPIWIRSLITNGSDRSLPVPDISVNFYPESPISILSFDKDTQHVCCCLMGLRVPNWSDFRGRLLPGESRTSYHMVCTQGLAAGEYHVNVLIKWESFAERPSRPPTPPFKTFPVSVIAVPSAEQTAAHLYDSAYALRSILYDPEGRKRGNDLMLRIAADFPDSRYSRLALLQAFRYARLDRSSDSTLGYQLAYRILQELPTSPECIQAARDIIIAHGHSRVQTLLAEIVRSHPEAPVLQVDLDLNLQTAEMPPSPKRRR